MRRTIRTGLLVALGVVGVAGVLYVACSTIVAVGLNLAVLAALVLAAALLWVSVRPTRCGNAAARRLACAVLLLGMVGAALLNVDWFDPEVYRPDLPAFRDGRKVPIRQLAVAEARRMIGLRMPDEDNPSGVLCCDVAFGPYNHACKINEKLRADYYALADPTTRYPRLYDVRRCTIRKNLKFIADIARGETPNTPETPYFFRRINNLAAYLKSRGCFYGPDDVSPKCGMIVFFQRPGDSAPTHVAMISQIADGKIHVIQTSATYDGDTDSRPDLRVVEVPLAYVLARTTLVGYGDVVLDD